MPRSFLVKKSLKGEDAGYHSYRVREAYDHDVLDVSLKAVTPYTPYTPPALPAAAVPLTVRVNNGYIHDVIPSPIIQNGGDAEKDHIEASTPLLESESAATESFLYHHHQHLQQQQQEELEPQHPQDREKDEVENREGDAEENDQSHFFNNGVTVGYTYDAFFISDGRSKRKNSLDSTDSSGLDELRSHHHSGSSSSTSGDSVSSVKGRQRYTCNECGKDYATSSNLSRHKQTHRSLDSKNAKQCPHCDKVYVSMPALSMHILTHDLRHSCTVCGKTFSRPWLLQGHMRSHTGEKPYGCAHCGKAFADRSNLRAHMQTHSAFKHYTCNRCNKSFALKSYLNKHYESACIKE